jgi:hypothetical protein
VTPIVGRVVQALAAEGAYAVYVEDGAAGSKGVDACDNAGLVAAGATVVRIRRTITGTADALVPLNDTLNSLRLMRRAAAVEATSRITESPILLGVPATRLIASDAAKYWSATRTP